MNEREEGIEQDYSVMACGGAYHELADLRQQLAAYQAADEAKSIEALRQAAESLAVKELEKRLAEARATAEAAENRHADECMAMTAQRQYDEVQFVELQEKLAAKSAEIERLRERLEAAERFRFGSLLFSCSNNGWECFRMSDGNYLGDPPHSNTFIYKSFDDAYQSAISAGWLPPASTNNEP